MSVCRRQPAANTPDRAEQAALLRRWRDGDAASADHLARSYHPVVHAIARRWWREPLQLADLTQEGRLAIIEALRHYDDRRPLTPYVVRWVEGRIKRHVMNFHGPVCLTDDISRAAFFVDPKSRPRATPIDHVHESLPAEDAELAVTEAMAADDRRAVISKGLSTLSARERDIVNRRVLAEKPETLASIAAARSIRLQSVHCLEVRAMSKLRHAIVTMMGMRFEWLV